MTGRPISWSSRRGVDVGVAKQILDPLLAQFTKTHIARVSGLSYETIDHIDHLKVRRVDSSTVRALSHFADRGSK